MEEERSNDDNMEEDTNGSRMHSTTRAAAQGQAVLNDSMDSNGSKYSLEAFPNFDGLIQNDANRSVNENNDEHNNE